MADEELVAELAEHLAERDGRKSLFTAALDATERTYRDEYLRTARVALAWLAERGRLVPDGAQVSAQWATEVTVNGASAYWPGPREQAQHYAATLSAARLVRRQVITGPWVDVDEETT